MVYNSENTDSCKILSKAGKHFLVKMRYLINDGERVKHCF